jgi:hypothetical protein
MHPSGVMLHDEGLKERRGGEEGRE